ncbi:MAG: LytTR family DNA-binding domain-containing protein [Bacteroidales bacterium]|nr:LytTR family DNA-binding domain-containing protein [Bacteroidales bacterium]
MMKCIIVEDEIPALKLLADYASRIPDIELVGTYQDAMSVLGIVNSEHIDLMFLDIQMPLLTGIDLLKTMNSRPMVVITTAYAEYAVEGYHMDVIDYLLKPIPFERFLQAVNKALRNYNNLHLQRQNGQINLERNYFFVKEDYKLTKVLFDDILFIEGMSEYVRIHTTTRKIVTLESLKNLELKLPSDMFIRIHKSYIVAVNRVTAIVGNSVEIKGSLLTVGKSYRNHVMSFLKEGL